MPITQEVAQEVAASVFLTYPLHTQEDCEAILNEIRRRLIPLGYDHDRDHIGVCYNPNINAMHVHICTTPEERDALVRLCVAGCMKQGTV